MRKLLCLSILSMSITISHGMGFPDSGVIQDPVTGHSYQRIDAQAAWDGAKEACEAQGGYLATITSQA